MRVSPAARERAVVVAVQATVNVKAEHLRGGPAISRYFTVGVQKVRVPAETAFHDFTFHDLSRFFTIS